ncbi:MULTISPECIES: DUF2612 domain-containing protein [unclassified Clostridium]|uniref:DUF2612 domain-containing protein n=1 Tax=unclassified Clostridium TaxID=2614128 RepID=UPI000297C480|nr:MULTISPECIES: DUF2612 domain-containing protein [unclassified Clostridium]EKQ56259.1 MAG: Protein of unknown function (DUF2612) [Clostridium sp. Maddingley MBC34-26]
MAINNYLDNITSQHRDKPKFISWLSKNLTILDNVYNTIKSMDDNFDLDNAIGAQLDTLGIIIGRNRELTFQPLNGFSPVMDDDTYRLALKSKVAMNNWNGTIPQMYEIWDNIFGEDADIGLQIQDNQDMSFTAFVTGYVDQIQQDLIQHGYIVPKSEGVQVNYISKSPVIFSPYSGMLVSNCKKETINMSFNPIETITFATNSSIITGGITTSSITLK